MVDVAVMLVSGGLLSFNAARVSGPTIPVWDILCAFWNFFTAFFVIGPKYPVVDLSK